MVWKSLRAASLGVSVEGVPLFEVCDCVGFHILDVVDAFSESEDEGVGTSGVA